jgi:hypothetical protein
MRFQIRTLQIPTKGCGAFMPTFTNIGTAATNGQNEVVGMPGTVPIPSPRPAAMTDSQLGGPYNQPSSCAPNWFLPSIYYARMNPTLQFSGRTWSDNVLPVPAKQPTGQPRQWQHRVRVGGRTTTTSNRAFTQWPTYSGRLN